MSEATEGLILNQEVVLPERIKEAIRNSQANLSSEKSEKLPSIEWVSLEHRDHHGLPDFNIFIPKDDPDSRARALLVAERAERILSFLHLRKGEVKPFSLLIDPTEGDYLSPPSSIQQDLEIEWKAFYSHKHQELWVRTQGNFDDIDHEAAHWATCSYASLEKTRLGGRLIVEGFASWVSWQIKDQSEKTPETDYHLEALEFPRLITLNTVFAGGEPRALGALLFEVLFEKTGEDIEKLKLMWLKINEAKSVTDWLEINGFSGEEIKNTEEQWQAKIKEQSQCVLENQEKARRAMLAAMHNYLGKKR